ncbi:MAG: S4 domain-containing protein [Gammaproteobacteria bacterium]
MVDSVRIDKWLWAARFYKTRSLAAQSVGGGKVQLNGRRIKPAKNINVGDHLTVTKEGMKFELTVLGLAERRGSASIAQTLYEESANSILKREQIREQHRLMAANAPHPERRPDKKARRQLRNSKIHGFND